MHHADLSRGGSPGVPWRVVHFIDNLLEIIREWGIEDVHFTSTADIVDIPRLLRIPSILGKIGIIYGKK